MASLVSRRRHNDYQNGKIEDITMGLDRLQLSAIAKASAVSKVVTDVTLGPNCKSNDVYSAGDGLYKLGKIKALSVSPKNKFPAGKYVLNGSTDSNNETVRNVDIMDSSSRSTMKLMYDLDQERRMEVKDSIKERFLKMEEDSRNSRLEMQSKQQHLKREIEAKYLREEQMILRKLQEEEILSTQRQEQLAQVYKQHAQRMMEWNEKIKEEERRQKEAEEEEKRRLKEKKIQLDKMYQCQLEYRSKCEQIVEAAKECKDKQVFVANVSCHNTKLKSLSENMEQLVQQCKVGEISNASLQTASSIVQQVDAILGIIKTECDKINKQHDKEVAEANAEKQKMEREQARETQAVKPSQSPALQTIDASNDTSDFVNKEAYSIYVALKQHVEAFENSCNNLLKDDAFKKFRFECQKAINIPVNAISPTSADHLQDKLFKLSRLISGQPVEVGHGQVVASSHPQGIAFCKNLLAKKFVRQGELTVSSKPEAAFAIAAVIEALWADFPDFGQLVLGHFHRECPYLVPMFMPQVEGQSNESYYRSLGYQYNENGEVEKQDKFLKRMSGIMRLYAAILVTRPCRYQQNKSHPHGLSQAWRWISCLLNMEPRPDICATLLFDFLEVAGNSMYSHYGQQFQKLLHLICKEYFPKIEKVTPSISSGPMIRLEAFLQKILKQGHILPPVGLLPPNFW